MKLKKVVITGSTRGIGNSLARNFLKKGCNVVISGRKRSALEASLVKIKEEIPNADVHAVPCDVRRFEQVQHLWDESIRILGHIDIWINNAGISNPMGYFWEIDEQKIGEVINTNLIGSIYGTKIAINGFIRQGYGALYNLEGLGSKDNRKVKGLSIYGTTKAALHYFDQAAALEINNPKVIIGALQPGMVLTDMIMGQYKENMEEWEKAKSVLNFLSEDVEKVTKWLVDQILANKKNNARLAYSSSFRLLAKLVTRIFRKKENRI
jgi:short-subunit dehydrogenase